MGFAKGPAEDGEVLGKDVDRAAIDVAIAGDDAVAEDLVFAQASAGDEHAGFVEGAWIEEEVDTLSRGQLAFGMLLSDALGAATK